MMRKGSTFGEVVTVDTKRVRPFADQPREYFDSDALISLEVSIKQRGQIQPGLVRELDGDRDHDFELVDGQRRWHACRSLGVKFSAVIIHPLDEREQYEISVAANFQRADHTPMEIAKAIVRLYDTGRSEAYIATLFGKSAFWVSGYKRLVGLIPEFQKLLDPETPEDKSLPVTTAMHLARMDPEEQHAEFRRVEREGVRSLDKTAIRQHLRMTGKITERTRGPADQLDSIIRFFDSLASGVRRIEDRTGRYGAGRLMEALEQSGRWTELQEKASLAQKGLLRLQMMFVRQNNNGGNLRAHSTRSEN